MGTGDTAAVMRDILRIMVGEYVEDTEVPEVVWTYSVESNGDGVCERRWSVTPGLGVRRAILDEFEFGFSGGSPATVDLEALKVKAWDIQTRRPIKFALVDERVADKRIMFLFPAVGAGRKRRLAFNYTWPGLWRPLIEKLEDVSRIALTRAQKVKVIFKLPTDLRLKHFEIDRSVEYRLLKGGRGVQFQLSRQIHQGRVYYWKVTCERA